MINGEDPELSVIVPAHNEAKVLKRNLMLIGEAVRRMTDKYEIIAAEDGCTDGTEKIAKELASEDSRIIHFHSNTRLGKGLALKRALKASRGGIVVFMDADLATSPECLPQLVRVTKEGYAVAIGSRHVKGSYVKRSVIRGVASRAYNLLVRLMFRTGVHDHQIGFKAFNAQKLKWILNDVEDRDFFFDTELIVRARQKGFDIVEIPVKWCEPKGRLSTFRLLEDGLKMGIRLLKLKLQ